MVIEEIVVIDIEKVVFRVSIHDRDGRNRDFIPYIDNGIVSYYCIECAAYC